jgi:hypothetical protein
MTMGFYSFVTTLGNERVWYRYSNVKRTALLITVRNGNEVTGIIFLACETVTT